jgi:hypothetical protein
MTTATISLSSHIITTSAPVTITSPPLQQNHTTIITIAVFITTTTITHYHYTINIIIMAYITKQCMKGI